MITKVFYDLSVRVSDRIAEPAHDNTNPKRGFLSTHEITENMRNTNHKARHVQISSLMNIIKFNQFHPYDFGISIIPHVYNIPVVLKVVAATSHPAKMVNGALTRNTSGHQTTFLSAIIIRVRAVISIPQITILFTTALQF